MLKYRSQAALAAILLNLTLTACSSPHPLEREVAFERAMIVEALDEGYRVDGVAAAAPGLRTAIAEAHERRGGGNRIAAVLLVSVTQGATEPESAFTRRRARRLDQALEELRIAGAKDINVGPLRGRPTAEPAPPAR